MKNIRKTMTFSVMGAACLAAQAADFKLGDSIDGKFNATVTLGTQIRAESPNPEVYSAQPSLAVPGMPRGKLAGQTNGSDLNYAQGNPISTVVKGAFDLDIKKDSFGVFVRGNVWRDLVQGQTSVPYGNYPNAFVPNTALSDNGFSSSAKFNNAELRDYFAYGKFDLGNSRAVDAKVGRQVLQWGGSLFTTGGINSAINPVDYASQLRAGALPTDGKLPVGMISAKLTTGSGWSAEGFLPYEFRSAALPGCGTYFDVASFAPEGCNFAALAGASEQASLAAGNYLHRNADATPQSAGQFGLAIGFKSAPLNTEFRGYAMNTHSTMPSIRMTVNNTTVVSQLSANYANLYVPDVTLFGASFSSKLNPTATLFGEVAYRPNQPINLNGFDAVAAFVQHAGILAQNKGTATIPVGGVFDAYDRFGVITASVGTGKVFPKALGAERVSITAELGFSHVDGLPDPKVLRYGRQLPYNGASYTNAAGAATACTPSVPGKTCTTDGYITTDAWGLRALVSATYVDALLGASLTPSLLIAQDMDGYSYDGTFSQGRSTVRSGVRADWGKSYFMDLQYTQFGGGNYNLTADRSYLGLTAGARF